MDKLRIPFFTKELKKDKLARRAVLVNKLIKRGKIQLASKIICKFARI